MKRFIPTQAGDTIIEVMLSLVVLGLILGSVAALAGHSTNDLQTTSEHSVAQRVAQTQLEYLRQYVYAHAGALANDANLNSGTGFCMVQQPDGSYKPDAVSNGNCQVPLSSDPNGEKFTVSATLSTQNLAGGQTSYLVIFHISWNGLNSNTNSMDLSQRLYEPVPVTNPAVISVLTPPPPPPSIPPPPPPPPTCTNDSYIATAVDRSPSMGWSFPGAVNREEAAKDALRTLVNTSNIAPGKNLASITEYSGKTPPNTLQSMSSSTTLLLQAINKIDYLHLPPSDMEGTDAGEGLYAAYQQLKSAPSSSKRVIILLGDGYQHYYTEAYAISIANAAGSAGVDIYTVGIFPNNDPNAAQADAFFRKLVRNGGRYFHPTDASTLKTTYFSIGQEVQCTP